MCNNRDERHVNCVWLDLVTHRRRLSASRQRQRTEQQEKVGAIKSLSPPASTKRFLYSQSINDRLGQLSDDLKEDLSTRETVHNQGKIINAVCEAEHIDNKP